MKKAAEMIGKKIDELITERGKLEPGKKNYKARWDAMTDEILSLMDIQDELRKTA